MNPDSSYNSKQSNQKGDATIPEGKILVQFDGMCILCSRTIKFILKTDKKNTFVFQAIQDSQHVQNSDTVLLTDHTGLKYEYFDAVLKIGSELGGVYKSVAIFRLLPKNWRKSIYLWVARNRFSWFGSRKTCYLPTETERARFI